ncbi:MAG: hypothetical protein ABIJ86_11615, partial [Spirochaetota bacterium]
MGDENQIRKIVSEASRESLAKSLELVQKETKPYDLFMEFSATKLNRSFFVPLVTLATVVFFAIVAIATARVIQTISERQEVDISSFDDLNLKDLLDVAKRTEDEYVGLQRELSTLERERDAEIHTINEGYAAELEIITARRISDDEKRRLEQQAAQRRDQVIKQVELRFAPLLEAKALEVASAADRLEQYDSRMLDQARQNEEMLAAERKVFELEQQQLVEHYEARLSTLEQDIAAERIAFNKNKDELMQALQKARSAEMTETNLRYNPVFNDPVILALLEDSPTRPEPLDTKAPASLLKAGLDASALETLALKTAADIRGLGDALADVPYFNSIPPTLAAMEKSAYALADSYRRMADTAGLALLASQDRIKALEAEISSTRSVVSGTQEQLETIRREQAVYSTAIDALAQLNGDAGYVLEATTNSIKVWLRPISASMAPDDEWIVRGERTIATVSLSPEGPLYTAT